MHAPITDSTSRGSDTCWILLGYFPGARIRKTLLFRNAVASDGKLSNECCLRPSSCINCGAVIPTSGCASMYASSVDSVSSERRASLFSRQT